MREIKFRAWDSKIEKFIYSDRTYDHSWFEFQEDSPLKAFAIHGMTAGNLYEPGEPSVEEIEECQIFTGLQDCNSKDIYEGDILKWNNSDMIFPITIDSFHGYRFMWGKDTLIKAHAENGEIIGNIYKN